MTPETEARLLEDVGAIKANVERLLSGQDSQGSRIGKLESKMWWGSGAIAVIAAIVVPKMRAVLGL